ncbi:MAG: putative flippase GtrA [Cyclobacteriaceae bacterium]|jgi:putative flippase GtrA
MIQARKEKPSGFVSFLRYNVAAVIATTADFSILLFLKEILEVNYVLATCLAATIGAVIAFILGRYWAFLSTDTKKFTQIIKYLIVAIGSVALNTVGVYLITNYLSQDYKVSKIIIAFLVAVSYNYPLSKYYTFK